MNSRPATIMIVDDTPYQRSKARAVFAMTDYEVIESSSGRDAIEKLRMRDVDVVLLDVMMPGMNGYEVCMHIRKQLGMKSLPVIMLASPRGSRNFYEGMEVGATEFIHKPFDDMELMSRVESAIKTKQLSDRLDDTELLLFAMAARVEARDWQTGNHSKRIYHTCIELGMELRLKEEELEVLRYGSILHDIGMIGVPESILLKEGPLTEEEWAVVKNHTSIGAEMCQNLKGMREVLEIVHYHHERWDGSGYPYGRVGEEIPYLVRIFQFADIYDALKSERPYRKSYSTDEIIEILEEETENCLLDPEIAPVFLNILRSRSGEVVYEDNLYPLEDFHSNNYLMPTG